MTSKSSNSSSSILSDSTLTLSEYLCIKVVHQKKTQKMTLTYKISSKSMFCRVHMNTNHNLPHIEFHKTVNLLTFILYKLA